MPPHSPTPPPKILQPIQPLHQARRQKIPKLGKRIPSQHKRRSMKPLQTSNFYFPPNKRPCSLKQQLNFLFDSSDPFRRLSCPFRRRRRPSWLRNQKFATLVFQVSMKPSTRALVKDEQWENRADQAINAKEKRRRGIRPQWRTR